MSTLTVATRVAAPRDHVFQVYTELDKAAERIPDITKLEILSEGPFGEGTRWRETRMFMKKEATEEMRVTGFDPPNSYTVEASSHGMRYETLFEFLPDGEETTVRWTFTTTPLSLGAKLTAPVFGVFMKGMMKKCMQKDLDAMRSVCEGKAPAGAS